MQNKLIKQIIKQRAATRKSNMQQKEAGRNNVTERSACWCNFPTNTIFGTEALRLPGLLVNVTKE
jgi:hypothetical protein